MILHCVEKPAEVLAIQFTRNNWEEVKKFTCGDAHKLVIQKCVDGIAFCSLNTGEDDYTLVNEGSYIVKNKTDRPQRYYGERYTIVSEKDFNSLYGVMKIDGESIINGG